MKKYPWVAAAASLCAVAFPPAYGGGGWTGHNPCNQDLEQTGAEFVTLDTDAKELKCTKIVGPFGTMHEVNVQSECDESGCTVTVPEGSQPFDAVVVGTKYESCVYMFSDATSAQYLTGPYDKLRFACSDGGVTEEELPDEPITSLNGGCAADEGDFSLIQQAVSETENIAWVVGVGSTDTENDKTGLCVQGGTNDLARCDEQCIVPVDSSDFPYAPDDPVCKSGVLDEDGTVVFPLSCRPCALTEEVPPPDGSKSYCWERSHQRVVVDPLTETLVFQDFFIPVKTKANGTIRYNSFQGSTCYQISTSYRGQVFSYWTPSNCP